MCGIFGLWHRDGRPIVPAAVRDAVTSLRHRGPNDEGYLLVNTRTGHTLLCGGDDTRAELDLLHIDQIASCTSEPFDLALGFRRLAIVDLTHAGFQPMGDRKAGHWLVFNGEIYNYLELRAELRSVGYYFKTGTDTEVILAAYHRWGRSCVNRFNGMWAFALWNQAERELLISRDRFGVKPLYTVCRGDTTFAFASEIKALLAGRVIPFSPSIRSVSRYVAFGRLPSHGQGETFVDGIQEFPVAHQAVISCDTQLRDRYWSLPRRRMDDASRRQATCTDYSELFADAVRLQLRGDVPIGTCLSGGLDSSSIVAEVRRIMQADREACLESLEPHQHTFSATYPIAGRWNEEDHIQRVIRHTGATAHFVQPTADGLWSGLEQLIWHQDEPFQSTSIFAQWCVMSLARSAGITVLLDGQGADELLGGYAPFGVVLADLLTRGRFVAATRELQQVRRADQNLGRAVAIGLVGHLPKSARVRLSHTRMRPSIKSSALRPELMARLNASEREEGPYGELHSLHSLDEHLAYLIAEQLPDLLRYEDRNSMAFSIESRVPFLDDRLVEFVFTRGADLRLYKGWTKWLHRVSVAGQLPDDIVWRRDKVGFETPQVPWFQASRVHILDLLSCKDAEEFLDLEYARRQVPTLLQDASGTHKVWRWLNLVVWLRLFRESQYGVHPQAP